jgi:hypothetical protein
MIHTSAASGSAGMVLQRQQALKQAMRQHTAAHNRLEGGVLHHVSLSRKMYCKPANVCSLPCSAFVSSARHPMHSNRHTQWQRPTTKASFERDGVSCKEPYSYRKHSATVLPVGTFVLHNLAYVLQAANFCMKQLRHACRFSHCARTMQQEYCCHRSCSVSDGGASRRAHPKLL